MKILRKMAKPLDGLFWKQRVEEGQACRLLQFVISEPVPEGLILYNVMTKETVLLDPEEAGRLADSPASVPGLKEDWFVVPLEHDDRELAREIRQVYRMLHNGGKKTDSYTILSTSDCNARCFYCYEKGRSRIHMSEETATATADYITRHSSGEKVSIHWFGGEPLYNKKAISRICSLLTESGITFKSSMISNGFLFDEETVAEAAGNSSIRKKTHSTGLSGTFTCSSGPG